MLHWPYASAVDWPASQATATVCAACRRPDAAPRLAPLANRLKACELNGPAKFSLVYELAQANVEAEHASRLGRHARHARAPGGVASSAEVAAAGTRLNWKSYMMEAAGAIRKVAADQMCKVPRKLRGPEDLSRSFFASSCDLWEAVPRICRDRSLRRVAIYGRRWVCLSCDLWEALGVPQDCRISASKNLQGIFWKVGQEIPGASGCRRLGLLAFETLSRRA